MTSGEAEQGGLTAMFAVLLGLVGLVLVVVGAGGSRWSPTAALEPEAPVLVTARAVPLGAVLTAADVAVSRVSGSDVAWSGVLHAPRQALGRRIAMAMPAGVPLLAELLADNRPPQSGQRRVRLHVETSALPSDLRADDLVDVVAAVADANAGRVVTVASGRVVSVTTDAAATGSDPSPPGATIQIDCDTAAAGRLLWASAFAKSLHILERPAGDAGPAPLDVAGPVG